MNKRELERCLARFESERHQIRMFKDSVHSFFEDHPVLSAGDQPAIHSVRSRVKDPKHLADKLRRKTKDGRRITSTNLFEQITDLAGVRVLLLHQDVFPKVHSAITDVVKQGHWVATEAPKAYTWDPESEHYFRSIGLKTELKESFYTSIHYTVRPTPESPLCCEIQVRTLFEEIWGELDHAINYPVVSTSPSCTEQLKVLAKFIGAGSRLAVSIVRAQEEHLRLATSRPRSHGG